MALGGAAGQPDRIVQCEAILTDYQARSFWGETIELGDTIGEADFIVPSATFTLELPEQYAGRTVKVVFLTYGEALPVSSEELGGRYNLELPEKYFDGPDGQAIRDISLRAIERSSGREGKPAE